VEELMHEKILIALAPALGIDKTAFLAAWNDGEASRKLGRMGENLVDRGTFDPAAATLVLQTAVTIIFSVATIFLVLFPRVMVSSLDETLSLTIYNASSSPYTLKVMTIIALTVVPIVLIYQGWTYWVFRQRLTEQTKLEY
jgi:cytochrome bd-type quinol oxidase subunit 2